MTPTKKNKPKALSSLRAAAHQPRVQAVVAKKRGQCKCLRETEGLAEVATFFKDATRVIGAVNPPWYKRPAGITAIAIASAAAVGGTVYGLTR